MDKPVVINLDWLEVYCIAPCRLSADYFRALGYRVEQREYGSRVWGAIFTLYERSLNIPEFEVRCCPRTSAKFIEPLGCHIRLTNYFLYGLEPVGRLRNFLLEFGFTFKSIYRFDVCRDFIRFDSGDRPEVFVRRYLEGRYSKINQCRLAAHADDRWERRVWQTLSWGSASSPVHSKLYNKSEELRQCTHKPYIVETWRRAGLPVDDGDVWRLEFAVRPSRESPWHLSDLVSDSLSRMWFGLAAIYFHFKIYEDGVRKDRCRDKVLWSQYASRTVYPRIDLPKPSAESFVGKCQSCLLVLESRFAGDADALACISYLSSRIESIRRGLYHIEPVDEAWMKYVLHCSVSNQVPLTSRLRSVFFDGFSSDSFF